MRVEFYMVEPMLVWHYAPIIQALLSMGVDASFVSCRSNENVVGEIYNAELGESLIRHTGLPVSFHINPDADMAVCYAEIAILGQYRKKRARIMYGCGIAGDSTHLRDDRYHSYDLVLVHGPFHHRIAETRIDPRRVAVMGYPRYDDWFNGKFDKTSAKRKFLSDRHGKPVLLYLPTWADRSSIDRFADAVFKLSESFVIVVKPHHCTQRIEKERMKKLESGPVTMLDAYVDPQYAYALADIVLGDITSGAYVEPLLLGIKHIGLGSHNEYESILHPCALDAIPTCTDPLKLADLVHRVHAEPVSESAERLRNDLFGTSEGYDASLAAAAIINNVIGMPQADPFYHEKYQFEQLKLRLAHYRRHTTNLTKLMLKNAFPESYGKLKNLRNRYWNKTGK